MSNYIQKGDQFWNDDHTEGYEMVEEAHPMNHIRSSQFKALGAAPEPGQNNPIPQWLADIICTPDGVRSYKDKAKA